MVCRSQTEQGQERLGALYKRPSRQPLPKCKRDNFGMDNLNTHSPSALYEVFTPKEAKRIWGYRFVYTPKHGSWPNMAEIELNVLNGQCLSRRIDNIQTVQEEVQACCKDRNNMEALKLFERSTSPYHILW
jgi:hypothetical protein